MTVIRVSLRCSNCRPEWLHANRTAITYQLKANRQASFGMLNCQFRLLVRKELLRRPIACPAEMQGTGARTGSFAKPFTPCPGGGSSKSRVASRSPTPGPSGTHGCTSSKRDPTACRQTRRPSHAGLRSRPWTRGPDRKMRQRQDLRRRRPA